jgi:hypothetical protein
MYSTVSLFSLVSVSFIWFQMYLQFLHIVWKSEYRKRINEDRNKNRNVFVIDCETVTGLPYLHVYNRTLPIYLNFSQNWWNLLVAVNLQVIGFILVYAFLLTEIILI